MKKLFVLFVLASLTGCTDAFLGKFKALGDPALVTCYSGGKLIYTACSTGKIQSEENSDGYYFIPQNNGGRPVEVSGNCVIQYNHKKCN